MFGRGYGEAILIHYGGGHWFAVDCLNDGEGRPAPLSYLTEIGVSPESVTGLLATHWHDDHVRGLSKLHEAFSNASFFMSIAMDKPEWQAFNQRQRGRGSAIVSSGLKELRAIASSQVSGARPHTKWAIVNRALMRIDAASLPHGYPISFEALGPSDADINAFLSEVLASPATTRRIEPFSKNDVSVPIWFRAGDHRILLGADLEISAQPDRGWNAVHRSTASLDGQALVVKIPHHGSQNGFDPNIWRDHVASDPIAIVSPWNRGRKLPQKSDIDRITSLTSRAYSTSRFDRKPPNRPNVVTKTLKQFNQVVRARPMDVGQVRVRFRPKDDPASWRVELLDGALPLRDLVI